MNKYYKLEQKDDKYLVTFERNRPKYKIYMMARHLVRTTHTHTQIYIYMCIYIYIFFFFLDTGTLKVSD